MERRLVQQTPLLRHVRKYWQLYALMVLPIIYFLLFKYGPMVGNMMAFRKYRPGTRGAPFGTDWIGFKNFERLLRDKVYWRAFGNTLITSLTNMLVNFPIPIIFALMLNELSNLKFKKLVQTISYMPRFVSTIVMITIVTEILSPTSGIINKLLHDLFGMTPIHFLIKPEYFRPIYVLTDTWQFTGWSAIIYLAAITGISQDLYESAMIDGASRWQQTLHITIPSIMGTVMIMLILNVGHLLSVGFEKILLLYKPENSAVADVIDTYVYRYGYENNNQSYATAAGLFGGLIGLVLVSSANWVSKRTTGSSLY